MAKFTNAKRDKKDSSSNPRSRAAKRATSPSIDVDKSIKEISRASGATPQLGITRNGGVSKKQKKKQMTRGQRARQEKGLARAEIVMDQLSHKKDRSNEKAKQIKQRSSQWSEVNGASKEEVRKAIKPSLQNSNTANDEWHDIDSAEEGDVDMKATEAAQQVPRPAHLKTSTVETTATQADELDLIT